METRKVVLAHDWLRGFRGGERVFEVFCDLYPHAPIYSLIHKVGTTSEAIDSHPVKTSWVNSIPGSEDFYPKLLPVFPGLIDSMKIEEDADLLLSSSSCLIKGLKKPNGSKHICYIHSPMRYVYDQFDTYFGNSGFIQKTIAHSIRGYLQSYDRITNQNVDFFIANSRFVQERIQKYYKRDSIVINPFVDLKDFRALRDSYKEKIDFYLMVTAFAPNKRVDLAIEAFNSLGWKLKIIGGGQEEERLKKMASSNVEFLGSLSREEVVQNMFEARGFVFPGVEDFGITPLEAIASGTPLIAFNGGGVTETMTHETCEFFPEENSSSLKEALLRFEKRSFDQSKLFERAEAYSRESFIEKMTSFINEVC
jgi:glycosyltransferase involved in cell wall biosynthesis